MTSGRVLLAGAWAEGAGYPRTSALREGLVRSGIEIAELRVEMPTCGVSRRRLVRSPWLWPFFSLRLFGLRREFMRELKRVVQTFQPDVVLVPYPGHVVAPWVRRAYRGPVVLDLFLSAYNTVVEDRRMFGPSSLPARLFRWLDRRACAAADLVLMDTPQQADYVQDLIGRGAAPVDWVPVGFADEPPCATPLRPKDAAEPLELLFFGTGVPLHGLELLIDAVASAPEVRLVLVGGSAEHRALAQRKLTSRLELCGEFVEHAELTQRLESAHVVAGIFGGSQKAGLVIPYKVVHALAAGRPAITMDSPAVRTLLEPEVDCLVTPRDAQALAARLSAVAHAPAQLATIGLAARARFEKTFSLAATSSRMCEHLSHLVGRRFGCVESPVNAPGLQESQC